MQRILIGILLVLLMDCAALVNAQDGAIGGPVVGFVFDADAEAIRPILGVPGSALTGAPIDAGVALRQAAIAQNGGFAIALAGEKRSVVMVRDLVGAAKVIAIEGAVPGPDEIILSPGGAAAVLWYKDANIAQVWRRLAGAPTVSRRLDLSVLPGPPSTLALSDDGSTVLASAPSGASESIFAFDRAGNSRLVLETSQTSAIRFLHNSGDAVIADAGNRSVLLVRKAGTSAEIVPLANGIGVSKALGISADNRRALVASPDSGAVIVVDLEKGGIVDRIAVERASALDPLQTGAVFRLTGLSDRPMLLLDTGAAVPRVLFVPPAVEKGVRQ
jgi:hypothetical protein